MKPNWKDAPEWAQYLAQDSDGSWYWYEQKPEHDFTWWKPVNVSKFQTAEISSDWQDSLEKRPERKQERK